MSYIERWAEGSLASALRIMRIGGIAGPRQCGKTTLMRQFLDEEKDCFLNLDLESIASRITDAPADFLENLASFRRIGFDEAQKAPSLFGALKAHVDLHPEKGRFILTGSSNFRALPVANESLAGRIGIVRLRTLAEGEIQGSAPSFFRRVLERDLSGLGLPGSSSKNTILDKALAGGFPEPREFAPADRLQYFSFYVDALLERDLKDLGSFRKLSEMRSLLAALAATSSKIVKDQTLLSLLGIDRNTLSHYLAAVRGLYLMDEVPAWAKTPYEKIGKTPKRFVTDTGLLAALLGFGTREDVFRDEINAGDFSGKLIETWVYTQIAAQAELTGGEWSLYHFRTHEGKEIDLLLENRRGDLIAVEIKGKDHARMTDFRAMDWFSTTIAKDRKVTKVVLCAGEEARIADDDHLVLPMSALWL